MNLSDYLFYRDDWAKIYLGDCREILPMLEPVDLVLTDPPYNSGLHYGAETDDNRADYWTWLGDRIALMLDLGETVLIKHSSLKIADFIRRWPSRILVWSKPFSSGFPLNGIATHWEPIHWLKGKSVSWSKDLFECSAGNCNHEISEGHPAQMPEKLASHWINTFTSLGNTILDPFMGSGTTLVAAKNLNRKSIGIEIEEKYCAIAVKRLRQEVFDFRKVSGGRI